VQPGGQKTENAVNRVGIGVWAYLQKLVIIDHPGEIILLLIEAAGWRPNVSGIPGAVS
jgi:hypothetical protein